MPRLPVLIELAEVIALLREQPDNRGIASCPRWRRGKHWIYCLAVVERNPEQSETETADWLAWIKPGSAADTAITVTTRRFLSREEYTALPVRIAYFPFCYVLPGHAEAQEYDDLEVLF